MTLGASWALRNRTIATILAVLVCSMNDFGLRKTTVLFAWLHLILDLSTETLMILPLGQLLRTYLALILLRGPRTLIGGGTPRLL